VKGLRNGELSVLTGPTGSGKTTFLSQLSLDLCQKGVNTLWGSFEIKNERFLESMIQQFGACDLESIVREDPHAFEYVCDKFQELPLYLMNFYGSTSVHSVIDTIEYAIHMY
jgi:twinkle protein